MKNLDEIIDDVMIPKNEYLIVFKDECLNPIRLEIDQTVDRPNNPTDDEIIQEHISFEYGHAEYDVWSMNDVQYIRKR